MKLRLPFTPMGEHQVRAVADGVARGPACTCDPRFFPTALDIDCPEHGLNAVVNYERLHALIDEVSA